MGNITFLYTRPGGTVVDRAVGGLIEFRLWQRETVGERIRTIQKFAVKLAEVWIDAGDNIVESNDPTAVQRAGYADVELSDTSVNQCWVVVEKFTPNEGRKTFYKKVDGDAAFVDLVNVDQSTLVPLDPTQAASAQEVLEQAAAAAADALDSADNASGFADDAAGEADAAGGFADAAGQALADLLAQKGAFGGLGTLNPAGSNEGRQPDSQVNANLTPAALSSTYVTRESLYLKDFLTPGATTAQNRTAFQNAITTAETAGKDLCYDGAYFTFTGAAVRSAVNDMVHWATGTETHKIVQSTLGNGVLRIGGERVTCRGLYFDGNNPALNLNGALPAQTFWMSYGICFEPTAHAGVVQNFRVSGFMRGIVVSPLQMENMDGSPSLVGVALVQGITVRNILSEGCWTAFQTLGTRVVRASQISGWYQTATGSGAGPHLVYLNGPITDGSINLYNEDVVLDDGVSSGGVAGHAFKIRGSRKVSVSNLRAFDSYGLLDVSISEDVQVGTGCMSARDKILGEDGSVSIRQVTRGEFAPMSVSFSDQVASTVGVRVDECVDVTVTRPRVVAYSGLASSQLLTVRGPNPGCRIVEPELVNLGASISTALGILESSGLSGSSSQAKIIDPRIQGTFSNGVRVSLSGATIYHDASRNSGTRKILLDSTRLVNVINRVSPDRVDIDPQALGWHNGEQMDTNAANRWPDGRVATYTLGTWAGNDLGRLTADSGGGRLASATYTADVDVSCSVRLGTATRAGIALRAVSASSYLALVRASGAVKLVKVVGSTTITELATAAVVFPNAATCELRAIVIGTTIVGLLNGVILFSHTLTGGDDTTFVSAVHGVYGHNDATAAWEMFRVRKVT